MLACLNCCISRRKVPVDQDVEDRSADFVVNSEYSPTAFIPDKPSSRLIQHPPSALPSPRLKSLARTPSRDSRTHRLSLVLQNCTTVAPQLVAGIRRSIVGPSDRETLTSPSSSRGQSRPRTTSNLGMRNTLGLSIPADSSALAPTEGPRYSEDPFAPPTPGFTTRSLAFSLKSTMQPPAPAELLFKPEAYSRSTSCLPLLEFPSSSKGLPDDRRNPVMSASLNRITPSERSSSGPRLSSDWDTAELFLSRAARESATAIESPFAIEQVLDPEVNMEEAEEKMEEAEVKMGEAEVKVGEAGVKVKEAEVKVEVEEAEVNEVTSTKEDKSKSSDSGLSANRIPSGTRKQTLSNSRIPRLRTASGTLQSINRTEVGKDKTPHHPSSQKTRHRGHANPSMSSAYFTAIDHD